MKSRKKIPSGKTKLFYFILLLIVGSLAIKTTAAAERQTIILSKFDQPNFWQFAHPKLIDQAEVVLVRDGVKACNEKDQHGNAIEGICILTRGADFLKQMEKDPTQNTLSFSADLIPEKKMMLPPGSTSISLNLQALSYRPGDGDLTFVPEIILTYVVKGETKYLAMPINVPRSPQCRVFVCTKELTAIHGGLNPQIRYTLDKISFPGKRGKSNVFLLTSLEAEVVNPREHFNLQTPLYITEKTQQLNLHASNLEDPSKYRVAYMVFPRTKEVFPTINVALLDSTTATSEFQHCYNKDKSPWCKPFDLPLGNKNKKTGEITYGSWHTPKSTHVTYPGCKIGDANYIQKCKQNEKIPSKNVKGTGNHRVPEWKVMLQDSTPVRFLRIGALHQGATFTVYGISADGGNPGEYPIYTSDENTQHNSVITLDFAKIGKERNLPDRYIGFRIRYTGRPTYNENKYLYDVGLSRFEIYPSYSDGNYGDLEFPPAHADLGNPITMSPILLNTVSEGSTPIPLKNLSFDTMVPGIMPGSYLLYLKVFKQQTDGSEEVVYQTEDSFTVLDENVATTDSFFGMNVEFFEHLEPLERIGVGNIRVFVNWDMLIETDQNSSNYLMRDAYKWPSYQNVMLDARSRGMKVDVVFNGVAKEAYFGGPQPENRKNIADTDTSFYVGRDKNNFRHFPPLKHAKKLGFQASNQDYGVSANVSEAKYMNTLIYDHIYDFVYKFHDVIDTVEIGNEYDLNSCVSWSGWYGLVAGAYYDCSNPNKNGPDGMPMLRSFKKKEDATQEGMETTKGGITNPHDKDLRRGEYMELLRAAYVAVRHATSKKNSNKIIPVAMMGLTHINLQDICRILNYKYDDKELGSNYFDVINIHSYWGYGAPEETTDVSDKNAPRLPNNFCKGTPFEMPDDNLFPSYSETLDKLVTGAGSPKVNKEVWVTEFGYDDLYGKYVNGTKARASTRLEQAVYTARAMVMYKQYDRRDKDPKTPKGISRIFNYIAKDDHALQQFFGGMGVTDNEHIGKKSMVSYQQITKFFSHTQNGVGQDIGDGVRLITFDTQSSSNGHPQKVGFLFKKDPGQAAVTIRTAQELGTTGKVHDLFNQSSFDLPEVYKFTLDWNNPKIILFDQLLKCKKGDYGCGTDTPKSLIADLEFQMDKNLLDSQSDDLYNLSNLTGFGPAAFETEQVIVDGKPEVVTGLIVSDKNDVVKTSHGKGKLKTPLKELTLATWFKSSLDWTLEPPPRQTIISKNGNYVLFLEKLGNRFKMNCLVYLEDGQWLYSNGWLPIDSKDKSVFRDAEWHHLTCAYDGLSLKFYHNGKMVLSQSAQTPHQRIGRVDAGGAISQTQQFSVGGELDFRGWDGASTVASNPAVGVIDDVLVFNRALTPKEVKSIFKGERTKP